MSLNGVTIKFKCRRLFIRDQFRELFLLRNPVSQKQKFWEILRDQGLIYYNLFTV